MKKSFAAGTHFVATAKANGELITILSQGNITPPKSEDGDKVYTLSDVDVTWTIQLTPEESERLQWVLGIHWLWSKYRRSLN